MILYRLRPLLGWVLQNCKRDAVISIASGEGQLITIKKAKELGLLVISVDQDSNAVGFKYSDETIALSTYDSEPIIQKLQKLQSKYEIVGIINRSSGPPVVTSAEISEAINLNTVSSDTAKIVINKNKLFHFCNQNNILCPKSVSYSSLDLVSKPNYYPLIVKPSLSLIGKSGVISSRGIEIIPPFFCGIADTLGLKVSLGVTLISIIGSSSP